MAQSYLQLETPYLKGDDVQALQENLSLLEDPDTALPYYNDTKDGVFGPVTYNAVMAFQAEMLLETTGVVSNETEDALYDAIEAAKSQRLLKLTDPYMRGSDVLLLQKQLNILIDPTTLLPFFRGELDGIFGPITNDAVIAFQKYAGIEVDGIVGPRNARVHTKSTCGAE